MEKTLKDVLSDTLETLIEMIEDDALFEDEIEALDEIIELIANNDDEELTEKRMSAKARLYARKYRMKNRARLKMIARKKKRCLAKIAGKTDKFSCDVNGRVRRIDRKRSRAAKIGARSR